VAISLLYLGLYRLLGLVISWRRSESDKEVEIVVLRHQVRVLERQLQGRSATGPPTERSSLPSVDGCRERSGGSSWSPLTPCCAGTGNSLGASGDDGEHTEGPGDLRCVTSSSN
jgi:hypothetical protein